MQPLTYIADIMIDDIVLCHKPFAFFMLGFGTDRGKHILRDYFPDTDTTITQMSVMQPWAFIH